MIVASPLPSPSPLSIGEQRVIFRGVTWDNYWQIFNALPQRRHSRLSYDGQLLEITMAQEDHEFALRLIELFIRILTYEMGMKLKTMGSTTINVTRLQVAVEPDGAFYLGNQPQVAGRNIDFDQDPPPDLVVDVDLTPTNIDRNKLYAAIGVPELWRYNGQVLRIYQLHNGNYHELEISPTFVIVTKEDLYLFLATAQQDEIQAERTLRTYLQEKISKW